MAINRETAFQKKRQSKPFHVKEWNDDIILSVMSGEQLDEFQTLAANSEAVDKQEGRPTASTVYAHLVRLCAVDETGQNLFTNDDIKKITGWQWGVLVAIAAEAMAFNGLTVKVAEASEKNSVSGRTESSGSV